MYTRTLLAALAIAGSTTPERADELWVSPGRDTNCSAQSAISVGFADIAADAATAIPAPHRCVEIEGVLVGGLLLEDGAARYRMELVRGDPSSNGAILGLYGVNADNGPSRVRVIGTLSNCATIEGIGRELNADDPVNLMGYCHSFFGITLTAVSTEMLGSAPLERMLPVAAGPTIGNLSPLAEGDTRRQMLAAAARFLTAIRARDRATLAVMHGGGPNGRRAPRDLERVLAIMLDQPDSPFADLQTRGAVTTEIFGWKPPLWADDAWRAETTRTGTADAIACFSERADAVALWPIDSKDADNIPGRPYACTRIHIGSTGMDAPASFDTDQARSGVAEPVR